MRIAIYGGTFDPVHHAHLILAREAIETLRLQKVIFVPAAVSPFKKSAPVASGEIRLSMLRAATKDEIGFRAASPAAFIYDRHHRRRSTPRARRGDLLSDRRRQCGRAR
ncbi:MAG: hypothetical protein E6L08_07375 [Verrucomicrobia bacterium]|nr:MAG: hypothetical protein E6L08_07375 [Verrucomicrobiota bacterium]